MSRLDVYIALCFVALFAALGLLYWIVRYTV